MQELVVVVDPDFLQVSPPRCIYITKSVSHHKSNVRRKIILILKSMWKRKGKGMENWLMNWSYPIPFYIYYLLRDYVDACACDLSCVKLCFFFFFLSVTGLCLQGQLTSLFYLSSFFSPLFSDTKSCGVQLLYLGRMICMHIWNARGMYFSFSFPFPHQRRGGKVFINVECALQ